MQCLGATLCERKSKERKTSNEYKNTINAFLKSKQVGPLFTYRDINESWNSQFLLQKMVSYQLSLSWFPITFLEYYCANKQFCECSNFLTKDLLTQL
jgi:hypothetical protein